MFQPFDLIEELRGRHLFTVQGDQMTRPVLQEQAIRDYIESFHARNGFSQERMGAEAAEAFDTGATQILRAAYPSGKLVLSVQMRVVWGRPDDPTR